jgi:hypothetical protein
MTDRRFNEEEVAAIFQRATETQHTPQRQLPSGDGLTLAELQEIGRQADIAPEMVAQAAASLGQAGSATSRRLLGVPVGIERTIELDRALSNEEWERLVVDLRETFDARGSVRQDGSLREWTNGNLQVLVEPTANGQRIRLRTVKGDALALMRTGKVMIGIAAVTAIAAVFGGPSVAQLSWAGEMVFIAAALLGFGAIRVPSWAQLRRKQMEEIAGRLTRGLTPLPSQDSRG